MTKTQRYAVRLAAGIVALAGMLACTKVLDFDRLTAQMTNEAGVRDVWSSEGQQPDKGPPPPDTGVCVPGPCDNPDPSALGECKKGTAVCYDSGTGQCIPKQAAAEKCGDGVDGNCNGVPDETDQDAHKSCVTSTLPMRYCRRRDDGGSVCANGCYTNSQCVPPLASSCNNNTHSCRCGNRSACSTPFVCDAAKSECTCGSAKLVCGSGENCSTQDTGYCICGTTQSSTGRACKTTERCQNSKCVPLVDAGPDKGLDQATDKPPVTPDKAIDQAVTPDKAPDTAVTPDKAVTPDTTVNLEGIPTE